MTNTIQPTQDRIIALDSMRGFALCGIIFANLVSFAGFYSLSLEQIQLLDWWDRSILFTIDFLIEGKFYSVFATLFGMGFALQYARFKAKHQAFKLFWVRRMLILMFIGLSHMYFIWHGDILTLYSLLGLCLLFFSNLNKTALLRWIVVLLTLPIAIQIILIATQQHLFWGILNDLVINLRHALGYQDISLLQMRTSEHPIDVFWANVLSALPRPMSYLKTGRYFQVFGQFLLGVYLVKLYLQERAPLPNVKTIAALLITGSVLNLAYAYIKAISGTPFSIDTLGLVQGIIYHLGCTIMALGYLALLYHLWQNKTVLLNLASLGRMALTVYLMQTSLCVVIFYGYGLGLMGQVPFYTIVVFGCGILFFQFMFVQIWFNQFRFGPVEYIWRRLGYR